MFCSKINIIDIGSSINANIGRVGKIVLRSSSALVIVIMFLSFVYNEDEECERKIFE